jgi:hypothetical protein
MKKAIIAAAACAALLAGQAAADTSAAVNVNDRLGADSASGDSFDGMGNYTWIYFLVAAAAIGGAAYAISNSGNNSPASP